MSFAVLVCQSLEEGCSKDSDIVKDVLKSDILKVPRRGSIKSGKPGTKPLTRQSAARLLKQMRHAWSAVREGRAKAFQYRVVYVALATGDCRAGEEVWRPIFRSGLAH